MSADATAGASEIAAAMREMLDGFRDAGVLLDSTVGDTRKPQLSPVLRPDLGEGRRTETGCDQDDLTP
jgi:hypothetical protein